MGIVSNSSSDSWQLAFPTYTFALPLTQSGRSCLFSPSKCVSGSRAQALTILSDCRSGFLTSLLTSSEEGRKGVFIPVVWMRKLRLTSHIHTYLHILVRMKTILWCKLTQLLHYLMAKSLKSLTPSGKHARSTIQAGPSWRWKKTEKEAKS